MFTPEMTHPTNGTYILMANHAVHDAKTIRMSIDYNLARIRFGSKQLRPDLNKCILVYDLRGQNVDAKTIATLESAFAHLHELEIWR